MSRELEALCSIIIWFILQGFLYCFLRIICTSNCCETSQTPIRKMSRQHKDNFFKGVKRKWMEKDKTAIHRNYDNYYHREFVTVRNASLESLSVTQLVEENSKAIKS